jgi:3',5'-cyclic AMP phosphodiesterase CpdA
VVCGDIVGDRPEHYEPLKKILSGTGVPFFFVPGNHDMKLNVRSDDLSNETYRKTFGPDYYSFNRGKVHYVALNNAFYAGRAYRYISYLPERQLAWLQQDLASVPEGSTVIVMMHIPSSTRETQAGEEMHKVLQNRQHLHEMLRPYNAHIFSGHMHYNDNFVITDRLFEHVHASVCAEFWQTPQCSDGTPQGYGVYEITGSDVQWYYKSVGFDRNFQFRAYPVGANPEKPAAVTVNVWNYDPQWKVNWYENGVLKGAMTQYRGHDPYAADYINKNREKFRYSWISTAPTEHLFFAEPSSPDAPVKIEVIDRFGNKYIEELK